MEVVVPYKEIIVAIVVAVIGGIGFLIRWAFFREKPDPQQPTTTYEVTNNGGPGSQNTAIGTQNIGMTPTDVGKVVSQIIIDNIPSWKAQALTEFREESQNIAAELLRKIDSGAISISLEEMKKPSSQYILHETIKSASTSDSTDIETLIKAFECRFQDGSSDIMRQTIDATLSTIPKLNRKQISFLGLVHFIKHVFISSAKSTDELSAHFKKVFEQLHHGLQASNSDIEYLAATGTLNVNRVSDASIILGDLDRKYKFFTPQYRARGDKYQAIADAIDWYDKTDIPMVHLTLTGKMLGCIALSKAYPDIDYSVWIS